MKTDKPTTQFRPDQLANFKEYVRIQRKGKFNMFDPRARAQTLQSVKEWVFNMKHYEELEQAVKETNP